MGSAAVVGARAVIWASLVDYPSGDESLAAEEQGAERDRLFGILDGVVKWENSDDEDVPAAVRVEIDRCFPEESPPILDLFAGVGRSDWRRSDSGSQRSWAI